MRVWILPRRWLQLGAAVALSFLLIVHRGHPSAQPSAGVILRASVVRNAATSQAAVALTFDDGPDPAYTPQILDILDRYQARATFFVLGTQATRYPELIRLIVSRGNEVASHGYSHRDLTRLTPPGIREDLLQADEAITRAAGFRPLHLRPPYGRLDERVLEEAGGLGYRIILWTEAHDTQDWSRPDSAVIVSRALGQAERGMILLMHDSGGDRRQTVKALPAILEGLKQQGFRCVTVEELLRPDQAASASQAGAR